MAARPSCTGGPRFDRPSSGRRSAPRSSHPSRPRRARRSRRPARGGSSSARPGPSMRRPDLVEERQRSRVPLERDAHEVAQRGLGLAFDVGRQAKRRDRLDVEPLVGLEQLDRLERDPRPLVRSAPGSARTGPRRAAAPSGTARRTRAPGRTRRSGRPPAAGRARRAGASRTSARPGRAPWPHRAARRRVGAGCTAARRRGAPRATGRRAPRDTRPLRPTSSESRRLSQACPTLTWVTTSKVRPRASATVSSANGSRLPPSREVGRRTPLAIALSLPPVGVMRVRTRSASPRSNRERTIASVV